MLLELRNGQAHHHRQRPRSTTQTADPAANAQTSVRARSIPSPPARSNCVPSPPDKTAQLLPDELAAVRHTLRFLCPPMPFAENSDDSHNPCILFASARFGLSVSPTLYHLSRRPCMQLHALFAMLTAFRFLSRNFVIFSAFYALTPTSSLSKRFAKYCLMLHPEKTRLLEFGRYAEERAKRQGKKKPGTFDFLGLTHICARSRRGKFTVHVRTMRKRLRRSLTAVAEWCQRHRHAPVDEQQKTLNAKLRGHYQYYGRPTNSQSLLKFYRGVVRIWRKCLNGRTRGNRMTWERYAELLRHHPLLPPRIRHGWM